MVKTWRWGPFACTAAPLPCCSPACPFSGYSLKCIYIYNKNSFFLYIYLSLSLHPHGSSVPLRPAPLVSCRGEAFLSVPLPRGPPTLQAPPLRTLCILMTVSCDVLISLVYSDLTKPLILVGFLFYTQGLPLPSPAIRCTAIFWGPSFRSLPLKAVTPFSFPQISLSCLVGG